MCPGGRGDAQGKSSHHGLILDYHPAASDEQIEAAKFYQNREHGLGHEFLDAVDSALATISRNPMIWRADTSGRRKYRVKRFPHLIIYRVEGRFLHVLAIAHASRKPDYWLSRDKPLR